MRYANSPGIAEGAVNNKIYLPSKAVELRPYSYSQNRTSSEETVETFPNASVLQTKLVACRHIQIGVREYSNHSARGQRRPVAQ